jgi:ribosomal protein S18 acetylase RimI-like enzyme
MKYLVRNYSKNDESQVNALAVSAFMQYSSVYDDWDGFCEKIGSMSKLSENSELIVVEVNSKIVGAVVYIAPNESKALFFKSEWAIIRVLVVSPDSRGMGIGRALTDECINRAQRDNAEVIALHTSEIMEVALSMYKKMGFRFYEQAPLIHNVKYGVYTKSLANN